MADHLRDERAELWSRFQETVFASRSAFHPSFDPSAADLAAWLALAELFEGHWESRRTRAAKPVPHRIHQIWLGGSLPREYRGWAASWRKHNPGWDYTLWDDRAILALGLVNERAFVETRNPGAKSDIARYEILYRFGGVYVDTDVECVRPLGEIADRCSFFAGTMFSDRPQIGNTIIGCSPSHELMGKLIEGLSMPTDSMDGMEILAATGPIYLSTAVMEYLRSPRDEVVIFPSSYFYPLPNFALEGGHRVDVQTYLQPQTVAIHYWETSWLRSPFRRILSAWKKRILKILCVQRG